MTVTFWRDADIFYVELANPPVNAINLAVRQGLAAAIAALQSETGVTRVIVSGGANIFAAGGDAREFDMPPVAPHLPDILNDIETAPIPWIAVLNGAALGGGLELALACRYRIAAASARLGLPEVQLGIVPGAGGTQRLPRLVGFTAALDMITTGKPIKTKKALALGLIDEIADDPLKVAQKTPIAELHRRLPVCARPAAIIDYDSLAAARANLARRATGQVAPVAALDLICTSTTSTFSDGLADERARFIALRQSPQAQALRHVFFSERGAKAPPQIRQFVPTDFAKIVVVGGGTMGAGIAHALLRAGLKTTIIEADAAGVTTARKNSMALIKAGAERGLIDRAAADTLGKSLHITSDYSAAHDADFAIEAVFENSDAKQAVLKKLQTVMPPRAPLATNTSYLDIDALATVLADPSRLIGLHFFMPAHIMKLVEIIKTKTSSDAALAHGFGVAQRLRKIPVLAAVCDGFIGNRILARYREAADTLLLQGASPWQIDAAMVAFGYPMGPYAAQDLSGLDIAYANRQRHAPHRDPQRRYVAIADRLVEAGRLGRKTAAGWYNYQDGDAATDPATLALIRDEAKNHDLVTRDFDDSTIQHRLLRAMINEAASILHEGIAMSARDIDLVTILGYGFPRWRGGLMHYADTIGAAQIAADLTALCAEDQLVWAPHELIISRAKNAQNF